MPLSKPSACTRASARRRAAARVGIAVLGAFASLAAAHEFPEPGFTVIHPWVREALKGTAELPVSMRIVQISADDRLLAASTPVGAAIELRRPAPPTADAGRPGIALRRGQDLNLGPAGPHLVLRGVNTDLLFGREYPLTLTFERAGEVPAALIVGQH